MNEIKKTFKRADQDSLDMWCEWEEKRYLKKCNTKMERKQPRGRPRTKPIEQVIKDIEMRGEN